jgi:hypothetical protein
MFCSSCRIRQRPRASRTGEERISRQASVDQRMPAQRSRHALEHPDAHPRDGYGPAEGHVKGESPEEQHAEAEEADQGEEQRGEHDGAEGGRCSASECGVYRVGGRRWWR